MTETTDDNDQKPEGNGAGPGRNTLYTEELADLICGALADGRTLNSICAPADFPVAESTVRGWATKPDHPFSAKYTRAREVGYHKMADEVLDIADDVSVDAAAVGKARLRVETRKWILSKALPKIYGDKLELSGTVNHTHEDRLRELEEMERAAAGAGDKGAASDTRH